MSETNSIVQETDLETFFNRQSEITDRVALVNSVYESNLDEAFDDLGSFFDEVQNLNLSEITDEQKPQFLSHISFHREIIADIITEARQLLIDGRRDYIKRLVAYHKELSTWFDRTEKEFHRH